MFTDLCSVLFSSFCKIPCSAIIHFIKPFRFFDAFKGKVYEGQFLFSC